MTPPTLEEHRAWVALHGRNYTDQPIKRRVAKLDPDRVNAGSLDNITRIIEGKQDD